MTPDDYADQAARMLSEAIDGEVGELVPEYMASMFYATTAMLLSASNQAASYSDKECAAYAKYHRHGNWFELTHTEDEHGNLIVWINGERHDG